MKLIPKKGISYKWDGFKDRDLVSKPFHELIPKLSAETETDAYEFNRKRQSIDYDRFHRN